MKIEKISENIIRVTISINDLESRNLDLDTLNYNSPAAQELFWDMMEQAEIEFGFDVADSQIIIEPVPDTKDGFIITITRIDDDADFESIHKYIKSRFKKTDSRVKRKTRPLPSTVNIYSFNSFDEVADLSCRINTIYSGDSSLYKLKEKYYLIIRKEKYLVIDKKACDNSLNEYGRKVINVGFFEGYLNEYGTMIIAHDAIHTLACHFLKK